MKIKIEIEKGDTIKSELHEGGEEDKELHKPCPFYYGYIIGTEAEDGDPIDAILFTEDKYKKGDEVEVGKPKRIIKVLDEGQRDDKHIFIKGEITRHQFRKNITKAINYIKDYKEEQGDNIIIF